MIECTLFYLVHEIIIPVISVYGLQSGLDDSHKDNFYDSLISVARKLKEKEIVVIAGDVNVHVKNKTEDFEDQNGGYGYGVINHEVTSSLVIDVVLVFLSIICSDVSIVNFSYVNVSWVTGYVIISAVPF